MRDEIRAAAVAAVREALNVSSAVNPTAANNNNNNHVNYPREIDPADVMDASTFSEVVRKIEASNRSNKFAIRLSSISKEGNKQQFLEMVDLRETLEKAEAALKTPEADLAWDDIFAAREAIDDGIKQVDARMSMIEKIDAHPLSWPVATEFQKLKRAKPEDQETEKLFKEAERIVTADRKKRDELTKPGSNRVNDRFHYSKRPGKISASAIRLLCSFQAGYLSKFCVRIS